jgi:hypothetical protein
LAQDRVLVEEFFNFSDTIVGYRGLEMFYAGLLKNSKQLTLFLTGMLPKGK